MCLRNGKLVRPGYWRAEKAAGAEWASLHALKCAHTHLYIYTCTLIYLYTSIFTVAKRFKAGKYLKNPAILLVAAHGNYLHWYGICTQSHTPTHSYICVSTLLFAWACILMSSNAGSYWVLYTKGVR